MEKLKVTISDEQTSEKLKLEYRKQILNAQGWCKQLAYDDYWQRDIAPSVAFPSGIVYMTFDEAWASTGCEDIKVEVIAAADAADATAKEPKLRLWICSECGAVKAFEEPPGFYEKFPPLCELHKEHWPDGEFDRGVKMLKTDTFVKVVAE